MGNIAKVVKEQIQRLRPQKSSIEAITKISTEFSKRLKEEIKKAKISADLFMGGSFAKNTFLKADNYDVDIFVRFDPKYENLSDMLEKILAPIARQFHMALERIHGSRDYFRLIMGNTPAYLEIIPVIKIKKPSEERNVTDLTYFHAPYIKKRIKGLEDQVRVTKQFMKASEVYGAETYVKGFSGYTVELLIIKYKSFAKLLRELIKVKSDDRPVIDIAKHYKKPKEVFIQLNEAKIHSPIILIDPTYKERNALAALSRETFLNFQKAAKAFLKSPSAKFFEIKKIDLAEIRAKTKKEKNDFIALSITTDKQPGDIAGTKLKKFFEVMVRETKEYFIVKDSYFKYEGGDEGTAYITAKAKKEMVRIGPPLRMKKAVEEFKKRHAKTFEKGKYIHAHMPIAVGLKQFLDSWIASSGKTMQQMHVTNIKVEN